MASSQQIIRTKEHEVEQYKEAAAAALEQLQWCVNYLYGIRKQQIARALESNHDTIVEQAGLRA
jgi:hypothetical protein